MDDTPALISKIRQGDKNSFALLYRTYFSRIFAFLNGLLQDKELAEEITQDVFFRLWLNREKLDPEMPFNSYLFSIAKNTVINFYKQKETEQRYLKLRCEPEEISETEENIYYKELQQLIDRAVEAMSQQQRYVFRLSREEGLSNAEIASKLNISKRTVEKHISNSLSALRIVIEKNYLLLFLL